MNQLETTRFCKFRRAFEPGSGPGGRRFKSSLPDQSIPLTTKHYEIRPSAPVRARGYYLGSISVSTATTPDPPRVDAQRERTSHKVRTPSVGPNAAVGAGSRRALRLRPCGMLCAYAAACANLRC